jgi:hypothetical protein
MARNTEKHKKRDIHTVYVGSGSDEKTEKCGK